MGKVGKRADAHDDGVCKCELCKSRQLFEMPAGIVEACKAGRLVLFAGAGIGTESRSVLKKTFYERIAEELGVETDKPFPELMSDYVDAKGRRMLLQRIKERLDYIEAFPGLLKAATRFHAELATLYHVTDIITTNWDPYFERETGALPLVTDSDFALADMPGRKVFKIHGSIYNLGSIVATEGDYRECYRSLHKSVLGSMLKSLLATKTVLFVGYSFGDSDFNRIYGFIASQMTDVLPRSYVVTLDDPPAAALRGAQTIKTDAAFFLHGLKAAVRADGSMLDDDRWHAVGAKLSELRALRGALYERVNAHRQPAAVLCGFYQDGAIHALERMLARWHTGEYSRIAGVQSLISRYDKQAAELTKAKRYHDVAYLTGYRNALAYLIAGNGSSSKMLPPYFVYGSQKPISSITAFKQVVKEAPELYRPAYEQAVRIVDRVGVAAHHRAEL